MGFHSMSDELSVAGNLTQVSEYGAGYRMGVAASEVSDVPLRVGQVDTDS